MKNIFKKCLVLLCVSILPLIANSQQIGNGWATEIPTSAEKLNSGVYSALNSVGGVPDNSHARLHLSVIRHFEQTNNHQLQIASSFTQNDRLFFRKIAGPLQIMNPDWNEIATRGANTFVGNQIINGNIGIGTSNPASKLVIAEGSNASSISSMALGFNRNVTDGAIFNSAKTAWQFSARDERFSLEGYNGAANNLFNVLKNGYVGIGTSSPIQKLEVNGGIKFGGSSNFNLLVSNSTSSYIGQTNLGTENPDENSGYFFGINPRMGTDRLLVIEARTNDGAGAITFNTYSGSNTSRAPERMRLTSSGNLGIGTTTPTNKLEVNGTIRTKEVIVEATNWPDYVFAKDYMQKSLKETEAYIKANNHLPDMPSASEAEQNGIKLSEMNAKLLQKIEELTLHLIDQNKRMQSIEEQNKLLKVEIELLKKK